MLAIAVNGYDVYVPVPVISGSTCGVRGHARARRAQCGKRQYKDRPQHILHRLTPQVPINNPATRTQRLLSYQAARRSAAHWPEHSPFVVRHQPRPASRVNRPEPFADWSPRETTTLIAPFDATTPRAS